MDEGGHEFLFSQFVIQPHCLLSRPNVGGDSGRFQLTQRIRLDFEPFEHARGEDNGRCPMVE